MNRRRRSNIAEPRYAGVGILPWVEDKQISAAWPGSLHHLQMPHVLTDFRTASFTEATQCDPKSSNHGSINMLHLNVSDHPRRSNCGIARLWRQSYPPDLP